MGSRRTEVKSSSTQGDESLYKGARGAQAGYRQAIGGATDAFNALQPQATRLAQQQLRGDFLNPETNPAFNQLLAGNRAEAQHFLSGVALPDIAQNAYMSGALGGSRQGVASGAAAADVARHLATQRGNLGFQNYQMERQNQINSPQLAFAPAQQLASTLQATPHARYSSSQQQQRVIPNQASQIFQGALGIGGLGLGLDNLYNEWGKPRA